MKYVNTIKNKFLASNSLIIKKKELVYVGEVTAGLVKVFLLNRKIDTISTKTFFSRVGIKPPKRDADDKKQSKTPSSIYIYKGGDQETDKGVVLHSSEYIRQGTAIINADICMTHNMEVLQDIAEGVGPLKYVLVLGHSIFHVQDIESSVITGIWINVDIGIDTIIEHQEDGAWLHALLGSGINPYALALEAGRG